jgi:ABC-type transport system substrate-binding protein
MFLMPVQVKGQEEIPEEQTFYFCKPETWRGCQLNPFAPSATGVVDFVYEHLALSDDVSILYGVADMRPILAESWRWVDNVTFEIKIRRIAHFRSGRPVTADDVLFSLELEMRTDIGGPLAFMNEYVKNIEKVDDYTVKVNLKPDYARNKMVYQLLTGSYILPKYRWEPLIEKYGTEITGYSDMNYSATDGSGPYTPIAHPASAVVLKRVENYWGEQLGWTFAPEYIYLVGDTSSDVMFRNIGDHKRDLCSLSAEMSVEWQRERSSFLGGWNFFGTPAEMHGTETWCKGVSLNLGKVPLFREKWLREALTYAVDYKKIAEAALYGQALPANHLSIYTAALPDYVMMTKEILEKNFDHVVVDSGVPRLAYDPELAIRILQEHCDPGSSVEKGWYYKGQKLGGWKLNTVAGWRSWVTACEVLVKNWKDIGIDVELNPIEWSTFYDVTRRHDFELTYNWIGYGNPPLLIEYALEQVYAYPGEAGIPWAGDSSTGFQIYWNGSYSGLPNIASEVKELIAKLWTLDQGSDEYIATFKRVCELVLPELAWIPTVQDGSMKLWNRIDRWVNWPTVDDPYEYRIHDTGINDLCWNILKHVYPAEVDLVDFKLSKNTAEIGETVTAKVTLKNNGKYEQRYKVAINLGPAKPGWELTEENLLAWKIVKVPPGETTVELPIKINEVGSYVLVVDNWRIGQFDPGEPLTAPLSVTLPTQAQTVTVTSVSTVTTATTVTVPTTDMASVAGAGVVALIIGVAIGWLVASRKK